MKGSAAFRQRHHQWTLRGLETHVVADDFSTVVQQVHQFWDSHWVGEDDLLNQFSLVTQQRRDELHRRPADVEVVLLQHAHQGTSVRSPPDTKLSHFSLPVCTSYRRSIQSSYKKQEVKFKNIGFDSLYIPWAYDSDANCILMGVSWPNCSL